MRRKDREITDPEKIADILSRCDCCRLAFADGRSAYVVPLNFGCFQREGKWVFCFHGAREGRKLKLIGKNGWAGFELDTNHRVNEGPQGCDYSFAFQSVVGEGPVRLLESPEEKRAALNVIMAHYSGKGDWSFPDQMLAATAVFELEAESLACKEHL